MGIVDDRMSASLDRHITGTFDEEEPLTCADCLRYDWGHCLNEDSAFYHKPMEPDDTCEECMI